MGMIRYKIEVSLKLVMISMTGILTLEEVTEYRRRITADRDFSADHSPIFDVRGAALWELTPEAMRDIAAGIVFNSPRHAYVVADDTQFGMVRMLNAFADMDRPGRELRPFRDMESARAWLLSGTC